MEGWSDFYVAAVGGSAALAGLLVVAISINIGQIMKFPLLPGRAAQTIIKIGAALVISSLGLFPGQPLAVFGIEALIIALAVLGMGSRNFLASLKRRAADDPLMWTMLPVAMDTLMVIPIIVGGALLVAGTSGGLYWIGVGIIMSFVSALENGWVLLIEILR